MTNSGSREREDDGHGHGQRLANVESAALEILGGLERGAVEKA